MFTRMLRPSRRQHHGRVSQNEESDNTNNQQQNSGIVILDDNTSNQEHDLNLQEVDNSMDEQDDEEELRAALALSMQQDDNTTTDVELQQQQSESSFANENTTQQQQTTNTASVSRTTVHFTSSSSDDEEDDNILQPNILLRQPSSLTTQTQRELQHRRQSTCTLLLLFFLMRLWIEAIIEMKPELIFLSVMGSVWTYRFFISRRLAEEGGEQQDTAITANNRGESGLDPAVNYDPDLGLMSFQAQLALAILESQRQAFQNTQNGGYNQSSNNNEDGSGVTPEAKSKWKNYDWGQGNIEENTKLAVSTSRSSLEAIIERANSSGTLDGGGGSSRDYGTLEHEDIEEQKISSKLEQANGILASLDDEEPSCSICLCEYEIGEKVTRLPCDHIYHSSCLNSWCEHHVRCPLCNYDLMDGFDQPVNVQQMARQHAEEQRAFRSVALSSLGRRIRTRRRGSSNRRGQSRGNTASALLAAAEDSIV